MKTYYHTCPDCGANLDPGEKNATVKIILTRRQTQMLEMNITITAADLAAAINNLAAALAANRQTPADKPASPAPANITPPVNNAPIQTAPVGYPQQPAAPLSATPAPPAAPAAVPTAAPTYTLEMIATAGTALVDAGKMDPLCNLLTKYGIDSITKLDPAQYGFFATELRTLGAQI